LKAREIRDLSAEEIREQLRESREKLFNLRFQASVGNVDDYTQMAKARKDIARMETVLREAALKRDKESGN